MADAEDTAHMLVVEVLGCRSLSGDADTLPIRTDARIVGATPKAGEAAEHPIGADRHGHPVPAAIADEAVLRAVPVEDAEIVLVDAA